MMLLIALLLLTGCVTVIVPSPTPTPTGIPWSTNTPTPEPTPTAEVWCKTVETTLLFKDAEFTEAYGLFTRGTQLTGWRPLILSQGRPLEVLGSTDTAANVRLCAAPEIEGWIPARAVSCQ